jgi:hypothetical protein
VFDNNGTPLWAWSMETPSKSYFSWPSDVTLDMQGNIYVVSQAGNLLQVFPKP